MKAIGYVLFQRTAKRTKASRLRRRRIDRRNSGVQGAELINIIKDGGELAKRLNSAWPGGLHLSTLANFRPS
jgi:hypothetical protein